MTADTFDLVGNGVPFATGIHTYQDAVKYGRIYSGRWPGCMIYMVYSGVYADRQGFLVPLAAFCWGRQLPLVIRLFPLSWYKQPVTEFQRETGIEIDAIRLLPAKRVRYESAQAKEALGLALHHPPRRVIFPGWEYLFEWRDVMMSLETQSAPAPGFSSPGIGGLVLLVVFYRYFDKDFLADQRYPALA